MGASVIESKKKQLWPVRGVFLLALLGLSAFLLKGDVWTFLTWWLLALILGLVAMPLTGRLFGSFEDRGWVFSKVLAIALAGFAEWFLATAFGLPFTTLTCMLTVLVLALIGLLAAWKGGTPARDYLPMDKLELIFWEELIFLAVFLVWTYQAGFNPKAYGTEKFMDYGFMQAMYRSSSLPATDMWYSQGTINYYYGGQYFAVFLTKLSLTSVSRTYNLMRAFVAGFAFALPFSLVRQMLIARLKELSLCLLFSALGGLLGGAAVCFAGNMHYVYYALVKPLIQRITGAEEISSYWFPDATRYIGYNPDVPDKTIHEFPCYSFILGDLHAHVVNIMFVLLLAGLLYAYMLHSREDASRFALEKGSLTRWNFWKKQLFSPWLLAAGFLLGLYQMNNYWDYVIYSVVVFVSLLAINLVGFQGKALPVITVTGLSQLAAMLFGALLILPFNLKFVKMVDGVALAQYHSLPHQLLILWGLPAILGIVFLVCFFAENLRGAEKKSLSGLLTRAGAPDVFSFLLTCCAIGLVLLPEIVYVRDIYENGNARANTMFKLTYQAYILFGIMMGYVIIRLLIYCRKLVFKIIGWTGLFLLLLTVGYFFHSLKAWCGTWWDPDCYRGLYAEAFLEEEFSEDAGAIRYLQENIEGSPVVLEANGDSYTGYDRVSAMTGLPTVLGWYVHEWLWRMDTQDLNFINADIEKIYTSEDSMAVSDLLKRYGVSYVFIGSKEREKYAERLREDVLLGLGQVEYEDPDSGTKIIHLY